MGNIGAKRKRENRKRRECGETGNTSEQPETFLEASTGDHQGRFTEI